MKRERGKSNIIDILIYCIWTFIFVVGIGDLFYVPYRSIIWFGSLGICIYVYKKFQNIPKNVYLMLHFIILSYVFGEIFYGFFYNTMNYDKVLHYVNSIMIAVLVYHIYKDKIEDKTILILFCISASLSLAVVWEIFEYGFDYTFGTNLMGVYTYEQRVLFGDALTQKMDRLTDTILDFIMAMAGLITFMLGYILKEKFGKYH